MCVAQAELDRVELELAGLDLGEVEQVVDDGQQGVGRGLDNLEVLPLLGVEVRVQGQLRHAEDRVHGGADLVADVGQELALGLARGLGRLLRLAKYRFDLFLLGDVRIASKPLQHPPMFVLDREHSAQMPAENPIVAAYRESTVPRLAAGERRRDRLDDSGELGRFVDGLPPPPLHLVQSRTGVVEPSLVVPENVPIRSGHPRKLWDRVGKRLELLLTGDQFLFRQASPGDLSTDSAEDQNQDRENRGRANHEVAE